jgi:hypothetical protein
MAMGSNKFSYFLINVGQVVDYLFFILLVFVLYADEFLVKFYEIF